MPAERRASYRVQLNPEHFTLGEAARLADYLAALRVSHLYSSPVLEAAAGSQHGYDVVNPYGVSRSLGGEQGWRRLQQALSHHSLALLLDIVPNHMAITAKNPWWWAVLENGQASRYASYFDVDWDPPEARNRRQIVLPVLGDHYGRVLEAGELGLNFDGKAFTISYYDKRFPVDPASLGPLLARAAGRVGSPRLAFVADAFAELPDPVAAWGSGWARRFRDQAVLKGILRQTVAEEPESLQAVEDEVAAFNKDTDELNALLSEQNYRLAFWRVSEQELSYRRFFNINSLVGVRVEEQQVFRDRHALLLGWLAAEQVDGLRVDHVDGLRDPEAYLRRLDEAAARAEAAAAGRAAAGGSEAEPPAEAETTPGPLGSGNDRTRSDGSSVWLLVEKILEAGERLPADWPIAGTTGYDFLNELNGLFVDPAAEDRLTAFYADFTGASTDYEALRYEKKRLVMGLILNSDVERLADLFLAVCERHPRYRDYTRDELRLALTEVAAWMPVYRTYVRPDTGAVRPEDAQIVEQVVALAKEHRQSLDPALFDFFRDLLLLRIRGQREAELVGRFQQFTGPVMAKGVEDTLFYCYNRFVSLNEVGGDPSRFGVTPEAFHAACARRQKRHPHALLTTSTHDTKRSEDVRARLNVISEMPEAWAEAVAAWAEEADVYRNGDQPSRLDEYLFYQTLVGAWPISEERMLLYMEKAVREAKRESSWRNPNIDYEHALADFVRGVMGDQALMAAIEAFVERLRRPGRINSLAQTLLKLTAPGVPDIYQGTELWDLSLVDPDNRRPVDYARRRALLEELKAAPGEPLTPERIMARLDEGLPKLWLISRTLTLRACRPRLFDGDAAYRPLAISSAGEAGAPRAVAFSRAQRLVTVVPRLTANAAEWGDATVELPQGTWHNLLTGEIVQGGAARLEEILARFPVALLNRH